MTVESRSDARSRTIQLVVGVVGAAALSVPAVRRGDSPLDLAVAWVLVGCGLVLAGSRSAARRPAWLLVVGGFAWLVGGVLHRGPLAQLLLTWPTGRARSPWVAAAVAFCYADALIESVSP